ncbi:MMPL family transporter [Hirschia maritima]|uniref:MMPL family transporter n=1 Tax=Hirschia maritima TaxID=1121961 RepID=UPI0003813156|nr:hypothetical protein [Hirschia maritima]
MFNRTKGRGGALLCVIWLVVCAIFLIGRFSNGVPIDTNIQSILPNQTLSPAVKAAMDRSGEVASNRVVFLVSSKEGDTLNVEASNALSKKLIEAGLFKNDQADNEELGRWIFANRNELLCEPTENFTAETAQFIRKTALASVYGVGGPVTGDLLKADPFLLTIRLANCLSNGVASLPANQSMLTGKLLEPAYAMDTQSKIQAVVSAWEEEWLPQGIELARVGAVFHAAYGAKSAKTEMTFIGGMGLIGVAMLFWSVFGRVLNVIAVASLIALSCTSGLAATLMFYAEIHMLVLVFAAMLVGVVADYAVHAMATGVGNDWPSEMDRRRHLLRPMSVSMLTTAAGFAGLFFLGVPLFQQLAVLAIVGVFTAWALVLFIFLPLDKTPASNEGALRIRWMRTLSFATNFLPISMQSAVAAAVFIIIGGIGFLVAQPLDDVRRFQPQKSELVEQEKSISNIIGSTSSQVFLVSKGETLDETKQNEEVYLEEIVDQNVFALTRFDPSQKLRLANSAILQEKLFSPYEAAHRAQLGAMEPDEALDVSVKRPSWFSDLHVEDEGKHYLIARLSSAEGLSNSEKNVIVDTASEYSQAFASYRALSGRSLIIAVCVALVFVFIVYRKPFALSIVLAPAAAMLCGIYLPAIWGQQITFFSMAGAMVLFGVSVDYSAFMWEAGRKQEAWTKASVLVGAVTTMLSMGLLALSETLPVRSFGITVAVGVICALIFSTFPYYLARKDALNAD